MAQLVKVVKYFDDGTETVHNFVPNSNAAEIEARVAENSMGEEPLSEVKASEDVVVLGEVSASKVVKKKKV
jgi:hypothetical protein